MDKKQKVNGGEKNRRENTKRNKKKRKEKLM